MVRAVAPFFSRGGGGGGIRKVKSLNRWQEVMLQNQLIKLKLSPDVQTSQERQSEKSIDCFKTQ